MIKKEKIPRVSIPTKIISKMLLKLTGWKTTGTVPAVPKYVMVGYPHTSNWDVFYGLLVFNSMGVKLNWIAKQQLFKGPLKWFFNALGAIPVNRKSPRGFIDQIAERFEKSEYLVMTLSPEGTRKKTEYWKTGFYRLARKANVPVAFAFLDYSTKTGGFGPLLKMSDKIKEDVIKIRDFYKDIKGKFPEMMGNIEVKWNSSDD